MDRVGSQFIAKMKEDVRANAAANGAVEKKDIQGKSLLALLVKANMASDLPENQRLSDEEVLAQCPTFILAGPFPRSSLVR